MLECQWMEEATRKDFIRVFAVGPSCQRQPHFPNFPHRPAR
jgi:hypothetical protein